MSLVEVNQAVFAGPLVVTGRVNPKKNRLILDEVGSMSQGPPK